MTKTRRVHKPFRIKLVTAKSIIGRLFIGAALLLSQANLSAEESLVAQETYKVAIIIDDLGNNLRQGRELIDMPYQLTYAFLPKRPYSVRLANMAASSGKEVMVHLPMQSAGRLDLGYGALTLELTQKEFQESVHLSINSVPHARGVNNHMGSLLTQHPGHMSWLMEVLSTRNDKLYFVDSKTTAQTVAGKIAKEHYVPNIARDVFLDSSRNEHDIKRQLKYLKKVAARKGFAVAIGHPYPSTIRLLNDYLPTLLEHNIEVVPVTKLIELHAKQQQWPKLTSNVPAAVIH
ncbi:MAG: divergent polysaccharide deacetylase family protein [Gammaproteobacteria bacterium]